MPRDPMWESDMTDYNPTIDDTDYEGERLAESAWLRYAESLGWEDAWMESMIESGLRSPY